MGAVLPDEIVWLVGYRICEFAYGDCVCRKHRARPCNAVVRSAINIVGLVETKSWEQVEGNGEVNE